MPDIALARIAAAAVWSCPAEGVLVQDVTAAYPWAHRHSLILAENPPARRMLIAVGEDETPVTFDKPQQIESLNRLLEIEGVSLPEAVAPERLAMTVRTLLLAPGGFVGDSAFMAREQDALEIWASSSPEQGQALFHKYCREPELRRTGEQWGLVFFYYNNLGGVEQWKVMGDSKSIREARSEAVVPDGTFVFPYG